MQNKEECGVKDYAVAQIRNVALVSHGGAGKTTLTEAMLFGAGVTDRLGRVDDGSSVIDYDPEEMRRKISITAKLAPCEWRNCKANVIDTPGYFDFVGEVKSSLRVVDSVVVVVCAVSGVEVGTELVWGYSDERALPRLVFVNKLDRENGDFQKVLADLARKFRATFVPLQLPIGAEDDFQGVVDLITMKACVYEDGSGGKSREEELGPDLVDQAGELREKLVEAAAEGDDELIGKYLEGEELSREEIVRGLRGGTLARRFVPVLCGSAYKNIGVDKLLDAMVACLPSPADAGAVKGKRSGTGEEVVVEPAVDKPSCGLVFKTVADPYVGKLTVFKVYAGSVGSDSALLNASKGKPERIGQVFVLRGKQQEAVARVSAGDIGAVAKLQETTTGDTLCDKDFPVALQTVKFPRPVLSMAVIPKAKGDEEKMSVGLGRLAEEDPTFVVTKNAETGQMVVTGMGEVHLEIITSRLQKKFGVEVKLELPKVPYRETIRSPVRVEGKHKKQTGGRGQYGHVWLELEPLPEGKEFEFVDKVFGGAVPRQYIPAVEKGVRETLGEGVLAGYPMVGVRIALVDGSYHVVDSSEMAFKIAASMALKKGALQANPVLLEPIMQVEVVVPEEYMGDIIGDLNKKRGKILGMEGEGGSQVIRALAPLAEMFRYATDLRSITQGRGSYSLEFLHYEEVPPHVAEAVIARVKKEEGE